MAAAAPDVPAADPVGADDRPGRVSGGSIAYGAPGQRVDLSRLFDASNRPASPGGSVRGGDRPATPVRTVNLSDGTSISFTVAGAHLLAVDG